ncbi:MAG TPA: Gfo/Idh/MocA family oxidoreductase [Tepidisphaeraceae bacterium]|nr:Gfo/Idh/MocA family oxidoreductase [Tepidisphaeraceae bacterium]
MTQSRRQFITTSAAASGLLLGAPYIHAQDKVDRIFTTAIIGAGWWGRNVLREAIASKRCKLTAMCDVDGNSLEASLDQMGELAGTSPKGYKDYRELLDKEKPEVVIIATPDHWHALQAIAALKAGAHVYVEKPTAQTINESRALLKTARDSGKVVQVGLHRRVGPHYVAARQFFRSGGVGELGMIRIFADGAGGRELPNPNSETPDNMNWDLWCGPGPLRPFNTKLHPGGWRNFLDYANGQLGDWGVHWLDQVQWFTDVTYPKAVYSTGGRPVRGAAINDQRGQTTDAPDHQAAVYEFDKFTVSWEHRQFGGQGAEKTSIGAYFYGSKGTLHVGWRDGWTFYPNRGTPIHQPSQLQEPDGHNIKLLWADFMHAIDTHTRPAADIEPAHRATVMALLGMLSLKAGRSVRWDGAKEAIVGDEGAAKLMGREYRKPWVYPG